MKTKKDSAIHYFVCLSIISMLAWSCESKVEKVKPDPASKRWLEDALKPSVEKVILLSTKYNVDPSKVSNMIEKFQNKWGTEEFDSIEKPYFERISKMLEGIVELSATYGIQKEIIASIIIEYKIWSNIEEAKSWSDKRY